MHFEYKSVPHNIRYSKCRKTIAFIDEAVGQMVFLSDEKGVMYMKILQDAMDNLPMVLQRRNSLVETIGEDGLP